MAFFSTSQTEALSPNEAASEMSLSATSSSHHLELDHGTSSLLEGPQGGMDNNMPALNMIIRQDPFSMTLDANALLAVSLFLLMGMHFVPRLLLESFVLGVPILLLIRNDYHNFLRLGPGGTPPTLAGYARLAWFRLFILRDPFSPPPPPPASARPSQGILTPQELPYRPGPRPTVAGLAPQRQLDQHGSAAAFASLKATLARLAARHPAKFGTATSCLEKHGFALFARHPVGEHVCGNGEVCHIHNSDRVSSFSYPKSSIYCLMRGLKREGFRRCLVRQDLGEVPLFRAS